MTRERRRLACETSRMVESSRRERRRAAHKQAKRPNCRGRRAALVEPAGHRGSCALSMHCEPGSPLVASALCDQRALAVSARARSHSLTLSCSCQLAAPPLRHLEDVDRRHGVARAAVGAGRLDRLDGLDADVRPAPRRAAGRPARPAPRCAAQRTATTTHTHTASAAAAVWSWRGGLASRPPRDARARREIRPPAPPAGSNARGPSRAFCFGSLTRTRSWGRGSWRTWTSWPPA